MAEFTETQVKSLTRAAELTIAALDESMRADDDINIGAIAGTNDLQFETVKPGRTLVIEHLSAYNVTAACTFIRLGYFNGHRLNWLETQPAPLVSETVVLKGTLRLRDLLKLEGWNDDDTYPHTFDVFVAILPRKAILALAVVDAIKNLFSIFSPKQISVPTWLGGKGKNES